MKERNRDQAWRMIVGFDRRRPTSDNIQMPTRRGNIGGRRSEASGFPARPGGVMPRHDNGLIDIERNSVSVRTRCHTTVHSNMISMNSVNKL